MSAGCCLAARPARPPQACHPLFLTPLVLYPCFETRRRSQPSPPRRPNSRPCLRRGNPSPRYAGRARGSDVVAAHAAGVRLPQPVAAKTLRLASGCLLPVVFAGRRGGRPAQGNLHASRPAAGAAGYRRPNCWAHPQPRAQPHLGACIQRLACGRVCSCGSLLRHREAHAGCADAGRGAAGGVAPRPWLRPAECRAGAGAAGPAGGEHGAQARLLLLCGRCSPCARETPCGHC